MTDILTRLRAWEAHAKGGPQPGVAAVRNEEAADEIERLRRKIARMQEIMECNDPGNAKDFQEADKSGPT